MSSQLPITVKFQDGSTRTAKLLGKDSATDVALLKVDPSGLTLHTLTLGSVRSLQVGDALFAIGDPFGYGQSLSTIAGVKITGVSDLVAAVAAHEPGDHVIVRLRRRSRESSLALTLTRQPSEAASG